MVAQTHGSQKAVLYPAMSQRQPKHNTLWSSETMKQNAPAKMTYWLASAIYHSSMCVPHPNIRVKPPICPDTSRKAHYAADTFLPQKMCPGQPLRMKMARSKRVRNLPSFIPTKQVWVKRTRSLPIAVSENAPPTPGSSSRTCSVTTRCATTTAPGLNGATQCGYRLFWELKPDKHQTRLLLPLTPVPEYPAPVWCLKERTR